MEQTTTQEPGLLDRMLAKVTGTETIKAELAKAEGALTEAVGRIESAEARATSAEAALEAAKVEHAAALSAAVAAAKIEGAQEFAAQNLMASAPEPLPHVEESTEAFTTHSAKWDALRASGDFTAAGEYYSKHKNLILEGK